jgi:hypothetical protein
LRLEQVGFSNKAVWGGAIKDANVADTIVRKNRAQLITAAGVKGAVHCVWVCATLCVYANYIRFLLLVISLLQWKIALQRVRYRICTRKC